MRSLPFTDLLSNIVDNRGKTCPVSDTGIPLIATNCVKNSGLYPTFEKVRFVDEQTYKTWFRGHPEPGDLVFVTKGSPGQVCLVPDPVPFCIAQDMVAIRANPDVVYPNYLFAALRSQSVQDAIENMHVGSLIPHFKKGDFSKLSIPVPEMALQHLIGDTFFELSSKIELNRKMNDTLEAMARALFRDWFVDFGPTRAKMEGRPAYLSEDLWSLFPDRLDEEGKPEGWDVGTMGDLFTLQRGFDLPAKERREGPFPILAASGPSGFHESFMVKGPGVTTGRSGVLGKVFFVPGDFWPLNTSLWVKDYKRATPLYAYQFLSLIDLAGFNAGSAVPTLNRNHVHGLPAVLPPQKLVAEFDDVADGLMKRHHQNELENETLAQTRDLLLPRLMSGELQIKSDAQLLESAGR